MTGTQNVDFAFDKGFSMNNAQKFVGVGIINGIQDQLSIWNVELDKNLVEVLVFESVADLSAYSVITRFNRSLDGNYWLLTDNHTLNHFSFNFSLISSIDILVPFQGLQ